MRQRKSARLLVISPAGNLLLFRFAHHDDALAGNTYWATPGGGLEEGETFESAARRELLEETGIRAGSLGAEVGQRCFAMRLPSGETVEALERYFLLRAESEALSFEQWTAHETHVMADHRWWPIEELKVTQETVWPERLLEMLEQAGVIPRIGFSQE